MNVHAHSYIIIELNVQYYEVFLALTQFHFKIYFYITKDELQKHVSILKSMSVVEQMYNSPFWKPLCNRLAKLDYCA